MITDCSPRYLLVTTRDHGRAASAVAILAIAAPIAAWLFRRRAT
jgi:hypothetical protein